MSTVAGLLGRRQLIADIGGGLIGGALLGAGFAIADKRIAHPIVAVVGRGATQAVLVRAASARILFSLGPWDDRVVDAILPVLGWSDRHIDLLICSTAKRTVASAWATRHTEARAIKFVVGEPEGDTATPREQLIATTMSTEIATDVWLTIEPAFDYLGVEGTVVRYPWTASIRHGDLTILFAGRVEGLDIPAFHENVSLLVIPEISPATLLARPVASAIATNVKRWMGSQTESINRQTASGIYIVRTFPSDPAIFELTPNGLSMPSWTERAKLAGSPTATR